MALNKKDRPAADTQIHLQTYYCDWADLFVQDKPKQTQILQKVLNCKRIARGSSLELSCYVNRVLE